MARANEAIWLRRIFSGKYGYLLASLLALLIGAPSITLGRAWSVGLALLAAAILVACIYAASPRRRSLVLGSVLAGAHLVIGQLAALDALRPLLLVQMLLGLAVMLYAIGLLLEAILSGQRVTTETLQAAMCVYLLLGLAWTHVYAAIEMTAPGAMTLAVEPDMPAPSYKLLKYHFLQLLYFSYGTLTTLGMDGVAPASNLAKLCVCLEAMTGQIYLTLLIARLVGMHIAQGPAAADGDFDR